MESNVTSAEDFTINMEETTSPSQLQEVTLDPDASLAYSVGMRSPNGAMRGRSVKEFEEQLTTLRKENFNLKLRIYFLEERMGTNFNMDQEHAVKKNIELMVELESLRKELQEKQELLCQAVKAMELEEEEHRKDSETKEKEFNEVKRQYEVLQQQFEVVQDEMRVQGDHNMLGEQAEYLCFSQMHDNPQNLIRELNNKVADLESQLLYERSNVEKLNSLVKVSEKSSDIKELQDILTEKEDKLDVLMMELNEKNKALLESNNKLLSVELELTDKKSELFFIENELKQKVTQNTLLHNEVEELKVLYEETKAHYDHEYKKNEKSKVAIANRNCKIMDLESTVDKYRTKMGNLELKLQTAQNEVKSKPHDQQTSLRSPKDRKSNNDPDSFLVRSPSSSPEHSSKSISRLTQAMSAPNSSSKIKHDITPISGRSMEEVLPVEQIQGELLKSKKHITKLEQDQLKACRIIQSMLEAKKKNTKEIDELQKSLQKRDSHINELKDKLSRLEKNDKKPLQTKISELQLTAAAPASDTEQSMEGAEGAQELLLQYKKLTEELDMQKQILLDTLKEKDAQMTSLQQKYDDLLNEVQTRDNRILDLEFELINSKEENVSKEKSDCGNEKISFWIKETEDKDKEIERLEKELSKRTCDLQSVVNKELWEKNREIEKLQDKNREIEKLDREFSQVLEVKDIEIDQLKKDIANRDNQLRALKDRLADKEFRNKSTVSSLTILEEELKQSLEDKKNMSFDNKALKELLVSEEKQIKILKEELNKTERLRIETQEICCLLSNRCEELAVFLDSLLQHKSVLGFLNIKYNSKLKNFIDQTLNLSKSVNLSISINPDQSLLQLSNITELLNTTFDDHFKLEDCLQPDKDEDSHLSILPDHVTLTYQSHLNIKTNDKLDDQAQIIKVLRNQIENLKHEIELRDNELAKKLSHDDEAVVRQPTLTPDKILQNLMSDKLKVNLSYEKNMSGDKNLLNTSGTVRFHDCSDSESWSEPDRNVSKERMGLQNNDSLKPKQKAICVQSESTELELNRSIARTAKKSMAENKHVITSLTQQITELDEKLHIKEAQLKTIQKAYEEVQSKFNEFEKKYQEECKKTEYAINERDNLLGKVTDVEGTVNLLEIQKREAEKKVIELQNRITQMEEALIAAETKKFVTEKKICELENHIETLQGSKQSLLESIDSNTKSIQNKMNEIEYEKNQAIQAAKTLEVQLKEAKNEIHYSTEKIETMEREMVQIKKSLHQEAEVELNKKLQEAEKDFANKIKVVEKNAEHQIKKVTDAATKLKEKFNTEYVKRNEVDKLIKVIHELESVQRVLQISEEKVAALEETESKLKHKLQYSELEFSEKLNELRAELDKATLLHSETILQKTQAENEKTRLENDMKEFHVREDYFEKQVSELKEDVANLNMKFQKQVCTLEDQKTKLQLKISQLESANADLTNKMIKMQTGRDGDQCFSAPTSPTSRILSMYFAKNRDTPNRQLSESSGGYISESHMVSYVNYKTSGNEDIPGMELERLQANSSPDLGIESDHGRFSSLEANVNVPRPFLQTLEVTRSLNQLLDKDILQIIECDNEKCCTKTKEMQDENTVLRKKLLKSNKLLEETVVQLAKANQRKREVERSICKQIHKTSQVLRKAKANLDSGSDNDLAKRLD